MSAISWIEAPHEPGVSYPAAPWAMNGQLWVSLVKVKPGDHPDREPGLYGIALVNYEQPSPLTYGELLVARWNEGAVTITDIWVDSVASMHGGRDLWAIPKGLAEFSLSTTASGPIRRAEWAVSLDGVPVLSARFSDPSGMAPRVPFSGRTLQTRADGEVVTAGLRGSSRVTPGRSSWSINPAGALGWLAGKPTIATFRQADFRMDFG